MERKISGVREGGVEERIDSQSSRQYLVESPSAPNVLRLTLLHRRFLARS